MAWYVCNNLNSQTATQLGENIQRKKAAGIQVDQHWHPFAKIALTQLSRSNTVLLPVDLYTI
jgi:hypothetical protein